MPPRPFPRSPLAFAIVFAGIAPTRGQAAQETTRASVDPVGAEVLQKSYGSALSADGRFTAFTSDAFALVAGDTNGFADVFVRDLATGVTGRVSVDSSGAEGNGDSFTGSRMPVSSDGARAVFCSDATNLVASDTNGLTDVFLRDGATGVTIRISGEPTGVEADARCFGAGISADGTCVFFASAATNLVANDTNGTFDAFSYDLTNGKTERISVDNGENEADGESFPTSISADGRYVTFYSFATNLVAGDHNGKYDVFVRDRWAGNTERASVGSAGQESGGTSFSPSISGDGRYVAFQSDATNLVLNDVNAVGDVFVHDRALGTTTLLSVDSNGAQGNGASGLPLLSGDGTVVAFTSGATNLVAGDLNGKVDAFVRVLATGATIRVSVDSSGGEANGDCTATGLSNDGGGITIDGAASDLVASDTNGVADVFVHELCDTPATWTNYGAGLAGTHGVPSFTARQFPAFGTVLTLDLANSLGSPTFGLTFVGFQRAALHTKYGSDLLVLPTWLLPTPLSATGATLSGTIVDDVRACAFAIDLQAIEVDAGAVKGVSFTQGLELVIGN